MIKISGWAFVILAPILLFSSCSSSPPKTYSRYNGPVNISFRSKKSGYAWDFNRVYKDSLIEKAKIKFNTSPLLSIKALGGNMIGGLDYKNGKIYFISSDLVILSLFNIAKETREIMFFDYTNEKLRLYNFTKRQIEIYSSQNKDIPSDFALNRALALQNASAVYRLGFLNNNKFIYALPTQDGEELIFCLNSFISTDTTNNKYTKITGLIKNVPKKSYPEMAYDGGFLTDIKSDYVVYSCKYAGCFFVFDSNSGVIKYTAKTVDNTPAPKASYVNIATDVKHLEITPNIEFFPSASLFKNKLYVLNFISEDKIATVDLYDLNESGKYISSFWIPDLEGDIPPVSISIQNGYVFVLYKNQEIVKYGM